jgi:hypothetical protein
MAVDKALNQAPLGLDATLAAGAVPGINVEPDIEIEIEDPESVTIGMDGMEIEIEPGEDDEDSEFNENLAEILDDSELTQMVGDLIGDYDDDISSRRDWMQTYVDGLELLGMKVEDRTEPWPGACGVQHPLLTESVVKFQAETMMETFPAQGPVRTQIIGKETPQKRDAARRVQDDMNYQLTDVMTEYRPEHERMLWGLGLAGNAFKKVYYDPSLGRQVSMYVPADDVVVPYGASNLESAERVTHVMRKTPNELKKLQRDGFYRDVELGEPDNTLDEVEKKIAEKLGFRATTDDRYKLLEMQVDLIIEDDKFRDDDDEGIALPYIVTIEKGSNEILAIRRNWEPDDKLKTKRNHFVHYSYVPGFGFYALGLIHLIGAFAKSGTSIIRQLVDAGTLSNLPGGFKTKGLRVKGDDTPISPAEWRDVDVASGTMRDNIMPLPYKEPSQVLYNLLGTIVEEGRRMAGMADLQVADMSANAPVGTTLAILERSLKMMSAVQARVHYAMKQEFKLLKVIIADYTPETYSYEPEEGSRKAKKSDYDNVDVLPVSDPNAATMAQKIVQYQAVIQLAQGAPQIYDMPYLHRQMLEVLGIKNASKLVPLKDDEDRKPRDPVSENMDVINGKPVKAFIYQDHEAHLVVHMSFMNDPKIQQALGQNPNAQSMMGAMMAHVGEHIAFQYRKQIEDQAGVPLPPPDSDMDENTELQISRLVAIAAQQLLQKDQAEMAQKQAQQTAQDPIVQMQMQELQLKQGELELKKQKLAMDAAEKQDRIELEQQRIVAQKEIAGLQVGAKIATAKNTLDAKQEEAGLRLGVEIAREMSQANQPPVSNAQPKETE